METEPQTRGAIRNIESECGFLAPPCADMAQLCYPNRWPQGPGCPQNRFKSIFALVDQFGMKKQGEQLAPFMCLTKYCAPRLSDSLSVHFQTIKHLQIIRNCNWKLHNGFGNPRNRNCLRA